MTDFYWNGATGDWTNAADWNLDAAGTIPAGAAPGTADNGRILAAGTYTVLVASAETVNVTNTFLGSSAATLQVAGTLNTATFTNTAGTLEMAGGSLYTGSVSISAGATINADVAGTVSIISANNVIQNAGTLNVVNGATLSLLSGGNGFDNSGAITVDSTSLLKLNGIGIGDGAAASASVSIAGTVDAGGAFISLAPGNSFGNITLSGTLENSVLVSNGGSINFQSGTLIHTTVLGTLDLGDSGIVTVLGGLTTYGAAFTGAGVINVIGSGASLLFGDTEVLNNVTINVGSNTGFDLVAGNGDTLTLGATAVVNSLGLNGLQLGGNAVINNGTINATGNGVAQISATSFTNAGVISITGGQTVDVSSTNFGNTGSISIDSASLLYLFGGLSIASSQASGGTVDIEGTLDANGNTIDLGANSAFANTTLGGTLENATILSNGGTITYNSGTLINTVVDGTLDLGASGIVTILGGLTVHGANGSGAGVINVTGNGAATLNFGDATTLDNVILNVGDNAGFNTVISAGGSLTLGAGAVVNSVGLNGLQLSGDSVTNFGAINAGVSLGVAQISASTFDNAGVISITGSQTVDVSSTNFSNTGSISIDSASLLYLFGGVSIASNQASGGTVDIEGTLDANGNTIDLGAKSAFANTTLGGTLENATILSNGGTITYNSGTLVNTVVDGTLDLGASGIVTILGGLTVHGANGSGAGVINVTGNGAATLNFGDATTLDNVILNVGDNAGFNTVISAGGSLTLGAGAVVNSVGLNGLQLSGDSVTNFGAINAGVSLGVAQISASTFDNAGVISITGGQTVDVSSTNFSNTGSISIDSASLLYLFGGVSIASNQASGGTVDIEGTLDANGNTIDLGAKSAFANTTLGGTLENAVIVSNGGTIAYNLGTLVNTVVDGTLDLGNSGLLQIAGGLVVNGAGGTGPGVINVTGSGAATLIVTDTETLDNVTINVGSNTGFDAIATSGPALVFGAHAVINSIGVNGLQLGGSAAVTNDGRIVASVANGLASIDSGSFTNAGTIAVSNRQVLQIASGTGTIVNTGVIGVTTGATVDINSALVGAGTVAVGSHSLTEFTRAVGSDQTIALQGLVASIVLDQPSMVAAKITGFASSDVIDLVGVSVLGSKVKAVGNTAVVTGASPTVTLNLSKPVAAGHAYGLVSDGSGGSDLILATVFNGPAKGGATINTGVGDAIVNARGFGNTITAANCATIINAGSGGAKVTAGNGNDLVNLSGVLNRVSLGHGNDIVSGHVSASIISLGAGNDLVQITGNLDLVSVGGGTDTINVTGNFDAIKAGRGADTITVAGNSDLVSLYQGTATVSVSGSHDIVFLGSGSATITDAAKSLNVVANTGVGQAIISGVASDPSFVLDLVGGVGGYTTAAQAYAALTSDGNGGSLLALGTGSVDFAGVAASQLGAKNFAVVHSFHA